MVILHAHSLLCLVQTFYLSSALLPRSFHSTTCLLSLTSIFLCGNKLEAVPFAVFDLPRIEHIDLSQNSISAISHGFGRVSARLASLRMDDNLLESVDSLFQYQWPRLENLSIFRNRLTRLPYSLGSVDLLPVLRVFTASGNPFDSEWSNLEADIHSPLDDCLQPRTSPCVRAGSRILEYARHLYLTTRTRRVSLFCVGDSRSGKTALLNSIASICTQRISNSLSTANQSGPASASKLQLGADAESISPSHSMFSIRHLNLLLEEVAHPFDRTVGSAPSLIPVSELQALEAITTGDPRLNAIVMENAVGKQCISVFACDTSGRPDYATINSICSPACPAVYMLCIDICSVFVVKPNTSAASAPGLTETSTHQPATSATPTVPPPEPMLCLEHQIRKNISMIHARSAAVGTASAVFLVFTHCEDTLVLPRVFAHVNDELIPTLRKLYSYAHIVGCEAVNACDSSSVAPVVSHLASFLRISCKQVAPLRTEHAIPRFVFRALDRVRMAQANCAIRQRWMKRSDATRYLQSQFGLPPIHAKFCLQNMIALQGNIGRCFSYFLHVNTNQLHRLFDTSCQHSFMYVFILISRCFVFQIDRPHPLWMATLASGDSESSECGSSCAVWSRRRVDVATDWRDIGWRCQSNRHHFGINPTVAICPRSRYAEKP